MKKIFLPILLVAFALGGCSKSDKNCEISTASFAGSYKVTSVKYKLTPTSAETDFLNFYLDACEVDDVTTFNANGTFTYLDAGVTCNPNGSDNGLWSLSGNTLTVDGSSIAVTSFSCNSFSITQYNSFQAGDAAVITFTRQ